MNRPRATAWSLACLTAAVTCLSVTSAANAATIGRAGDYNGDKYRDLAIGAPFATVSGKQGAGAVGVIRGTGSGLDSKTYQRLEQSRSWIPSDPRADEQFGTSLASGDLNGDGFSDLVTCAPSETEKGRDLTIALGSPSGLNRSFATAGQDSNCEQVESADFNRDGYADLIVGASPAKVAYGSAAAISAKGLQFTTIGSTPESTGWIGWPATGDVNGDGYTDLVSEYSATSDNQIAVFLGGRSGLPAGPSQTIDAPNMGEIAVGDMDGDNRAEVVAGNEFYSVGKQQYAGRVLLWRGGTNGIDTSRPAQSITQDTPGVPGAAESDDWFGTAIAIGDANHDGFGDLAIGAPGEKLGSSTAGAHAGMVTTIPGKSGGLNFAAAGALSQNTDGIPGAGEIWDVFGQALLFRDLNADGRMDLVVGSPGENNSGGIVHVLKGSTRGVTGTGAQLLSAAQFGISRELGQFGSSLG